MGPNPYDGAYNAGSSDGLLPNLSQGLPNVGLLGTQNGSQPASSPQPVDRGAQQSAPAQDPIAQMIEQARPSKLQTLLHAWGTGSNFNAARDDLTKRNIASMMLPAQIRASQIEAQNQYAIQQRIHAALSPGPAPSQGGGQPDATNGIQAAAAGGAPALGVPAQAPRMGPQAGGSASGFPLDRNALALMALTGDKNAASAATITAPKYAVDRNSGQVYDETTGTFNGQSADRAEYVNNQLVHPYAKGAPAFVPKYAEGTMPDGRGGVIPIPGYAKAAADAAGAVAGAQEGAKAPYDTVTINVNGVPTTVSKAQLAQMQGIVPGFAGSAPEGAQAPPGMPAAPQSPTAPVGPSAPQGNGRLTSAQAMQFYLNKGYKPEQAAGLVGNLIGESGLDAGRTADDGSYGLAQWTGPRLQGLFAFAKTNKLDPTDPNTQLEYSHYELGHGEKAAGDAVRNAGNVNDATAAAVGYERPAGYTPQNPQGASGFNQRLSAAQKLVGGAGGARTQNAPASQPFIAQGVNEATQSNDQKKLEALRETVAQRRHMATRANEFVQKMGNVATGPGYGGFKLPFAEDETAPVADIAEMIPGIGGKLQDLNAITNSTWAELRQAGQGPIKGYEKGDWKQAFPNIANWGPTNVSITQRLNDEAAQSERELAFNEAWIQKYGSLSANGGADAAWAKLPVAHNAQVGQAQQRGPQLPNRAPAAPRTSGPPSQAVIMLKRDPTPQAQQEFDQVFGQGAAKQALGGR